MSSPEMFSKVVCGVNTRIPLGSAVIGMGERVEKAQLWEKVNAHLDELGLPVEERKELNTGFEATWWLPIAESRAAFAEMQVGAMLYALDTVLDGLGATRKDVGNVVVASALPGSKNLAEETWSGARTVQAGCNSSDLGLDWLLGLLGDEFPKDGKLSAVLAVDSMLGLRKGLPGESVYSPYGRGIGHSSPLQAFSDLAGALVFDSSKLKTNWRVTHGVYDERNRLGCATVLPQTGEVMNQYDGMLLKHREKILVARIPEDRTQAVHMSPIGTTQVIWRFLEEMKEKVKKERGLDWSGISHIVVHPASEKVQSKARDIFELDAGLIPFMPNSPNAPSVAILGHWARIASSLEEGSRVLSLGFGAGVLGGVKEIEVVGGGHA